MTMCVVAEDNAAKLKALLTPFPDLLARKDLDEIRQRTNLPVSRGILYNPPHGLNIMTMASRRLLWKEDLIAYLCSLVRKPL